VLVSSELYIVAGRDVLLDIYPEFARDVRLVEAFDDERGRGRRKGGG